MGVLVQYTILFFEERVACSNSAGNLWLILTRGCYLPFLITSFISKDPVARIGPQRSTLTGIVFWWMVWFSVIHWLSHTAFSFTLLSNLVGAISPQTVWAFTEVLAKPNQNPLFFPSFWLLISSESILRTSMSRKIQRLWTCKISGSLDVTSTMLWSFMRKFWKNRNKPHQGHKKNLIGCKWRNPALPQP